MRHQTPTIVPFQRPSLWDQYDRRCAQGRVAPDPGPLEIAILRACDELRGVLPAQVRPRRADVFHVWCALPPAAQAAVADFVFSLRRKGDGRDRRDRGGAPRRLEVFHAFCALSPKGQGLVTEFVSWLRRSRAETPQEVRRALRALRR